MQLLEGAECEYNLLKYNELWPYEAPAARGLARQTTAKAPHRHLVDCIKSTAWDRMRF